MSVDMKVKAIYDSEISNITRSEKNWKDVLKVAGQLYRYEFDNIVMVTAQRSPEKSTLMADYDTWKKVGRYVKRGAKGCAIFPSRALNPRMRYIFDISDTGGKNVKLTWDLEGENLKSYADFLVSEGQMERYKSDDREDKNVSADISQNDTEPQEAAPETPAQEVLPPAEGLRGKEKTQDQTKLNFHYNLWETEKGGVKTRYQWNIDAICTLKQIEAENRLATQEEQTVLSKFVGWGGLSQAFDENNAGWTREYAELKELLSDEEYSAARATVNNAFYTSPEIAMCINSALVQFGFKGGNVLEPSMGIGNFFGSMPAPMQQKKH